jgi:hypothetical protein
MPTAPLPAIHLQAGDAPWSTRLRAGPFEIFADRAWPGFDTVHGIARGEAIPPTPLAPSPSAETRQARGWLRNAARDIQCDRTGDACWFGADGFGNLRVAHDGSVLALDALASRGDAAMEWLLGIGLVHAFARRGHFALHASAGLHRGEVVAFCAPSGTGKSTLARAIARRPRWSRVVDDILPLARDAAPAVWPRFPQLGIAAEQWYPESATPQVPLAAVFVVTRHAGETVAQRLDVTLARRALLANSAGARLFDASLLDAHLAAMTALAQRVPVFALALADRPAAVDAAADAALVACEAALAHG